MSSLFPLALGSIIEEEKEEAKEERRKYIQQTILMKT
jgi:hypothetical protein